MTTPPEGQLAFAAYGIILAAAVALSRAPLGHVVRGLAAVLPFAAVMAAFLPFTPGDGGLLRLGPLALSRSGLWRFVATVEKACVGATCAILLASTTRFPLLVSGLRGLGVPRPFLTMLSFAYRYAFVITDELERMLRARGARLAEAGLGMRFRSLGHLAGTLFIRSWERAERIYLAMLARGFSGTPPREPMPPPTWADLASLGVAAAAAIAARILLA